MGLNIIVRGKNTYGKTRSEQESNLRKDGFAGMSDENYDKCKYLEKKIGVKNGWIDQTTAGDAHKIQKD